MKVLDQDGISIEIDGRVTLIVQAPDEDVLSETISEYSGIPLGPNAPKASSRMLNPNLPVSGNYPTKIGVDAIRTRRDLFELLALLTPGVLQVWPPQFGRKHTLVEVDASARPIDETALELKNLMAKALDPEPAPGSRPGIRL